MMLGSIYAKSLRDRWLGLVIAAASAAAVSWMGVAAYSNMGEEAQLAFELLPEAFLSIIGLTTDLDPTALVLSEMVNFLVPMVLCGFIIAWAADAGAGEEKWGTIGVLLANPRSRVRMLAEKSAAVVTGIVVGAALIWGGYHLALWIVGADSSGMHLGSATIHLGALALFFAGLTIAIAAWTGSTTRAALASTAVLLVSFLAAGLLPLIGWDEPWVRFFPWYYLGGADPFLQGVQWGHVIALSAVGAALLVFAHAGIDERDLRVGGRAESSLLDRLRAHPRVAAMVARLEGRGAARSIWVKAASDARAVTTIAAGGLFAMALMLGPMFHGVGEQFGDFTESFPDAIMAMVGFADYGEPSGWYHGEIYSILAPIAVALVAITMGSRAIAGEERDRTMGLLLANPVSRTRVLLEKAVAMVAMVGLVSLATFVGTMGGSYLSGIGLSVVNVAAACVHLWAFGVFLGTVALLVGAATGRARAATGAGVGFAAVSYAAFVFLPLNPSVADWARLSPFHYYANHFPLDNGFHGTNLALMTAAAAALVALGAWAFRRRDLRG